ncbi:prolyl oligopeptidase family serine peptidase [Gammaproteobacteria bacterium AB-CW1]|uniref:Prolyl oligopeptidase family serine peptidase n=1 Tax=Natronospira elongata TaxID=3110268 RepID=A0AAP6JF87_9GAMM|nr:prolyl oligopeptidase family serine peptidase [Gammaproteobacteria bacterium AB-CW1]
MARNESAVAPYGSWISPWTAEAIARGGAKLAQPQCHQGRIYWLESLPDQGGRTVLQCWHDGNKSCLTADGYSIRSRAREYGGGAWCPDHHDGHFFINDSDQGLYHCRDGRVRLVTGIDGLRLADLQWDPVRSRLIAVCEDHREPGTEPSSSLVAVDAETGRLQTLLGGADFHAGPRLSRAGDQLAWVEWDHPHMPWDRTRLRVARLDSPGLPEAVVTIAGEQAEAIFQPEWGPDNGLYFVSDRESGWWNLYRWDGGGIEAVTDDMAEFGMPWWQFNMRSWSFSRDRNILAARTADGLWSLVGIGDEGMTELDREWSTIRHVHAEGDLAVMLAGRPDHPLAVVRIDPERGPVEVLASAAAPPGPSLPVSRPESISFPTGDEELAHALYYPPVGNGHQGPADERPPLLVKCHGGPTGATESALDPKIQFWTSRGFAVVDVNYRGSTGYGRAFRRRLYGGWGELDVADCVAAVDYLADRGQVDPARCLISGSSAGGYTVLAALTFTDHFAAGASHYGIGDLFALDATTHKFEARYTQQLVGPLPQRRDLWDARSPIRHVEQLRAPVIFFQGDQDKVVPPDQAQAMADALRDKGIPVAHVLFAGEGHGFRQAENVEAALAMELHFYGRVLGIAIADPPPELRIEGL